MQQTLLKFKLPERRLYASHFRDLLAKHGTLPSEFFHRDKNGIPLSSVPTIRIVGGREWVGILGNGDRGAELVELAMGQAIRILRDTFGSNQRAFVEHHKLNAATEGFVSQYWVREMVIRRDKPVHEDEIFQVAEERILSSLKRNAAAYGIDPSVFDHDLVFRVERCLNPRGLRVVTTEGNLGEYATLVDVFFTINRNLVGIWSVGNLTSRGYGRVGRDLSVLCNGPVQERQEIR